MPDQRRMTPKQTAHFTYMADVMRRLEWDLHNTIEMTGRIPEDWHRIARETPEGPKMRVNLWLDVDVVKFFKSMGSPHGPRINLVLKSWMHARLAGVVRGAETLALHRARDGHDGPKPAFGALARAMGETWEDEGPPPSAAARIVEVLQARYAAEGLPETDVEDWLRVR